MKIYDLHTNHHTNPLGFEFNEIVLSWKTDIGSGQSTYQKFARVEVSEDYNFKQLIYDSGKCENINPVAHRPDIKLTPRTTYYWRVTVWGDKEEVITSEVVWFETAKMDELWDADWISADIARQSHMLLRHEFILEKEILKARAYSCGLGLYEMELNGERVSDEYLAPGYHAYDYWLQYQTYDITDTLKKGKNAIGVSLGEGWYKGRFGFDGGYTNLYGDQLCFISEIIITFTDGTEKKVITNENWKYSKSPIDMSNIYDGEHFNAMKLQEGWSKPAFEDAHWLEVDKISILSDKFQARINPPVKIMERIKPIKIITTPLNETVLDFGTIITGWVQFTTSAPTSSKLTLSYGEILQEGNFYRDNLRTARAEHVYISDGKRREVRPHFTFFGFRYVKLEGFREELNLDQFEACVIYSEMQQTGYIETSNPDVNQLFQNALRGQKGNFLDVPTDCPQRDERMGWTGDAQIFVKTANFNMNSLAFFNKYLVDLREEQLRLGGSVPFTVPTVKPQNANGFINGHGSSGWGDAATIIPWTLYQMYGDRYLLKQHYPIMRDWVNYIKKIDETTGNTRLWQSGFHFGDWLALDGLDPNSPLGGTDSYFVASVFYYYSTTLVAKASKVLGYEDDVKIYETLSQEIKEAIFNEYFTQTGRIALHTQTALILSLQMDIVPEKFKSRVVDTLKKKMKDDKLHLQTGFVGTPYICNVLSNHGLQDEAYTLLLNDDYPSWLYSVKMGATTIWERWNSVLPDGTISGTGMNSLNHYAYGSIVEWMYRFMAGINSDDNEVAFKKINFLPKPNKRLKFSSTTYESAYGVIESRWEIKEDGRLNFIFKVPFNSYAELVLPDSVGQEVQVIKGHTVEKECSSIGRVYELVCGEYEFEYLPSKSYLYQLSTDNSVRELLEYEEVIELFNKIAPGLLDIPLVTEQFIEMSIDEMLSIPMFDSFSIDLLQLNDQLSVIKCKE